MTRDKLIEAMRKKINEWESLDKEAFIVDLLHWQTPQQMLIALNIGGPDLEDIKTQYLHENALPDGTFVKAS